MLVIVSFATSNSDGSLGNRLEVFNSKASAMEWVKTLFLYKDTLVSDLQEKFDNGELEGVVEFNSFNGNDIIKYIIKECK